MGQNPSTTVKPQAGSGGGRRAKTSPVLAVVLVILGILVMLYPVVSTVWNNHQATKAAQAYAQLEKDTPQENKNKQWDAAHKYNKERTTGPILDPWLSEIDEDNEAYAEYLDHLNANEAMARFIFPKIKADLPIYHGTDDKTLQKGLGHLFGSDLPVGGKGTHSVITGHTGLANSTMFDNLDKAEEGDAFYVQVSGHRLKYEVDQIQVVLPNETDGLRPVEDEDYITLITCTPYGINTHRLLVRAHAVPMDEEDEAVFESSHGAGWQWWMYALLALAALILLALLWWWRKQMQASGKKQEEIIQDDEGVAHDG